MSQRIKVASLAILTGVLWLGLSPQVAKHLYTRALLPRTDSETPAVQDGVEIAFHSGGYTLKGQWHKCPGSNWLVLFCSGRSSHEAKNRGRAKAVVAAGASAFVFEYRGFGKAEGRATVQTLLDDGVSAYDAVRALGYRDDQIVLYGESLGTMVASHVSSRRAAAGLVLQSGFSSVQEQLRDMIPLMRSYPAIMFPRSQRNSSADVLKHGHPPLLILHGDQDRVVDKKHAIRLKEAAGERTELVLFPGVGHIDLPSREDWAHVMRRFLSKLEQASTGAQVKGSVHEQ